MNGRWGAPPEGFDSLLSFLDDEQSEGAFRVLWLGDADVLPVPAATCAPASAYGTSDEGLPEVADRWLAAPAGPDELIAECGRRGRGPGDQPSGPAAGADGRPLRDRPRGDRTGPARPGLPTGPSWSPCSPSSSTWCGIDVDPEVHVFRNDAWLPERAALPAGALAPVESASPTTTSRWPTSTSLTGATPVLPDRTSYGSYDGRRAGGRRVPGRGVVDNWRLEVGDGGHACRPRRRPTGGPTGSRSRPRGPATLRYEHADSVSGVLWRRRSVLWLAVIGVLRAAAIRRREAELA